LRVGCPIRRSRDQRLLASPPGFSQRATSFIASQCQGIHQMPFLRSIPDAASATPGKTRHSQGQKPRAGCPKTDDGRQIPSCVTPSREDTLPQRQVNSSQPSATGCQLRTETPASVTLSSPCQRTLPPAEAGGNLDTSTIVLRGHRVKRPSRLRIPSWSAAFGAGTPAPVALLLHTISLRLMVEVNGIEPMTSCLQSRRSPN
jgi:hypothetical protein